MRIAFDLDETLGVPLIENDQIVGFRIRDGAVELLKRLAENHTLLLWSVSSRRYLDKILAFGLGKHFAEVYSWDDIASEWKDVRRVRADFLVDDSSHHRENAAKFGLEKQYIVVPAYGSAEDATNALLWVRQIEQSILEQ